MLIIFLVAFVASLFFLFSLNQIWRSPAGSKTEEWATQMMIWSGFVMGCMAIGGITGYYLGVLS